jgi:hypothetical protein
MYGERRGGYRVLEGENVRDDFKDLSVEGGIILI